MKNQVIPSGTVPIKHRDIPDPRIAISQHIAWAKPYSTDTEYSVPEPDNFNYAILADSPRECSFLKNQVLYKCSKLKSWWSVYLVPESQLEDFILWLKDQKYKFFWSNARSPKLRQRRPHLWTKKSQPELTDDERLFQMGYYAKLRDKYFSEDDTMLLERIGSARAEAYKIADEV